MVKLKLNKNLKTVSFDEEIITKDSANELLSQVQQTNEIMEKSSVKTKKGDIVSTNGLRNDDSNETIVTNRKSKRKRRNKVVSENNIGNQEVLLETKMKRIKRKLVTDDENLKNDQVSVKDQNQNEESEEKKMKKRKKVKDHEIEKSGQPEVTDQQVGEVSVENPKVKTSESIRAQKRKKHAKLLEEKRLKGEVVSQQNALNYLSKWKHCRSEWKFEKLKQIWLQQNLFDTSKIPSEFWETALEYFNGSKGFIRNVVLRDALKIIEKEESTEEENADENYLLIVKRARDIVQNLQE
ncbi:uncharacterized protein C7orf50 [Anoplophora glabripennis]|uniref:uncharacterized protein C7orf50 n=1 Tax=Anoplophora glabripennis TaxID=217634 RepID=UPI0008753A7C|nr:uncharacterized protein C7orf50 [Anoplophora glabripennis]